MERLALGLWVRVSVVCVMDLGRGCAGVGSGLGILMKWWGGGSVLVKDVVRS